MNTPLIILKMNVLTGLGLWTSIACFNNIIDRGTNRHLLHNMFSMNLLSDDIYLGNGLICRAINNRSFVNRVLWLVVLIQAVLALLLLSSAALFIASYFQPSLSGISIDCANYALVCFMSLWLWFLCGGLWFGYWIKMNHVQTTHLLLLILSLLATIIININR